VRARHCRIGARPRRCPTAAGHDGRTCRRIQLTWADGDYTGKLLTWAKATHKIVVQIVKRSDDATGFQVLPRRWVV
jgi:hypothetical protein